MNLLAKAVATATGKSGHQPHTISYAAGVPLSISKRENRLKGGTFNRLFASFMVAGRSLPSVAKRERDPMWRSAWMSGVLAFRLTPSEAKDLCPRRFLRSLRNGWFTFRNSIPYEVYLPRLGSKLYKLACIKPYNVMTVWGDTAKRVLRMPPDHLLLRVHVERLTQREEYQDENSDPLLTSELVARMSAKDTKRLRSLIPVVPRQNFLFKEVGPPLVGKPVEA